MFASGGISYPQGSTGGSIGESKGPQIVLGYNSFFDKRWGMGLVASGSTYKAEAVNHYSSPSGYNYSSSSPMGNWQKAQAYISFSYTPILKKRWAIDIVQGFGLSFIKQPAYDYYNYAYYSIPSKTGWGTAYNLGLSGRVLLKNNIGLFLSANFFHELGIPSTIKSTNNNVGAFDTVDWGLGIVYSFKKID